jgi:hypothetical protein
MRAQACHVARSLLAHSIVLDLSQGEIQIAPRSVVRE